MIRLYDTPPSGSCYKVRLILALLDQKYERIDVDFNGGEHKSSALLKLNPLGEIPVLVDDRVLLRDSQAILVYLARRYGDERWLPLEPAAMAQVVGWLSIAANEIQHGPNPARRVLKFGREFDLASSQALAHRLLKYMDAHLATRAWLAAPHPTIADVACYPYLKVAPEGGIDLARYPSVRAWFARIEALPGYVAMFPDAKRPG